MKRTTLRRRVCPDVRIDWPQDLHPVLRRIYLARGVKTAQQLDHGLASLTPPQAMGGLDAAVEVLAQAIATDRRIVVAGDYDCDGATGMAVAVRGLHMLGAGNVGFVVPNRFEHGYGLSPALVASLDEPPDVLVTVDNGIASVAGVAAAHARGIRVVVTDHHLPGPQLPEADAIVNPNLPGDAFPSKALAGVGVMFYLLLALRARLERDGRFAHGERPNLASLLDLVALGTVADVVPLDRNNRVLVENGLRRIRAGRGCVGLQALIEASGRSAATLTASDMGFSIGPRLNAAGRLEDMTLGVACLLTDDAGHARELAELLSSINSERRQLQTDMVTEAERMVENADVPDATGVALYDAGWHPGVVGLVASRLKERLHRPVVAFAPSDAGSEVLRGSARSIPGFHVRDALAEVDARHPGLMGPFGGHAMAAGLSLAVDRFDAFAQAFDDVVRDRMQPEWLESVLWTDGELDAGEMTLALARDLRLAGPWGQAFPEPLFENTFECLRRRPMGSTGAHARFHLRDPRDGSLIDAVMFNVDPELPELTHVRAAYSLVVNDWQGRETPRLLLRHVEPA
ncbi:single-stranded-DNA-specific exonuclease RecJ [Oleiagrimonas soli]|uniref:Single-stranded-DNA-specific exonuclease RecJ n=1 Tax=Oleiagrimonas soli TaxID=1543381 RepID=A0A099CX17_9GAMM|nr:single-stranded-DNA-specific exonuclease RecJ [Oleiagrimonas soli]KGI78304.1 ssDNA exonuclease RecJ [Oleiagrimonas soli]MBB6183205.1 single-stranded-DNA-specific exonuclease [Oleiagrimonas soli]